jgi:hypothetical protein
MRYLSLYILFILVISLSATAQNRVLDFDGKGSYVTLPSDIYLDLEEATIEAWVLWKQITYYAQPIGFGKPWEMMGFNNEDTTRTLQFYIYDQQRRLFLIRIPEIFQTLRWYHLARVTGKDGMKLYLNGVVVEPIRSPGVFQRWGIRT